MKDKDAVRLAKKRWEGKTDEDKQAQQKLMNDVRWAKVRAKKAKKKGGGTLGTK
jgi:hypothetical protein